MGTTAEWLRVLELGVFFAVLALVWDAITEGKSFVRWSNMVVTGLSGSVFGMWMVFEWRLFHGPLAVLFAAVFLLMAAAGFVNRRARRREDRL